MSVPPNLFSIHEAAKEGHVTWLKKASKRDLNKGDKDGWTAVHWCAWNGSVEPLRVIVDKGGDINKYDDNGSTPLHIAAAYGNLNALEVLIHNGSNLFSLDDHGRTAARVAAYYQKADCCRYLDTLALQWQVQNKEGVEKLQIKAMKELKKRSKKLAEEGRPKKISYDYSTAPIGGPPHDSQRRRTSASDEMADRRKLTQQDALRQNFELRSTGSSISLDQGRSLGENSAGSTFHGLPRNRTGPLLNNLAQLPLRIEQPEDARHSILDPLQSSLDSRHRNRELPQLELTGGHPAMTRNESALATFLHSLDLVDCVQKLHNEKLDLEALSMCSEDDLIRIGLSLGPIKKILNAIARRKAILAGARKLTDAEF